MEITAYLDDLIDRYPVLGTIRGELERGYSLLESCYAGGHKLLIAGNGGSASDAEHITGELMKSFCLRRPVSPEMKRRLEQADPELGAELARNLEGALPTVALVTHEALSAAYLNDRDPYGVFAQQVYGLGKPGDVFLGITTSGNSKNILKAAVVARAMDMKVLALTGGTGGRLAGLAHVAVKAPSAVTHRIQELHLPIYHCWCAMLEERFFGGTANREVR